MRYSTRTAGPKPARYSLSVANAQAKARKRGEDTQHVTSSANSSAISTLQKLSTRDGYGGTLTTRYKDMANNWRPKIYKSRPRGGSRNSVLTAGQVDGQWDSIEGPREQRPTPNLMPVTGSKRQRSADYEEPFHDQTTVPTHRKKTRYTFPEHPDLDRFATPTPLQDTNARTRRHQTPSITPGLAFYPPSPMSRQGPQDSTFSSHATIGTTPASERLDLFARLSSTGFEARASMSNRGLPPSPCPATKFHFAPSLALFERPGPLYSMEELPRPGLPTQAHQSRLGANIYLPYGQPYIRTETLPDHGRRAVAMSFQPTMPVIREESPATANDPIASPGLLWLHSPGFRDQPHSGYGDRSSYMPGPALLASDTDQYDIDEIYKYETPQPIMPDHELAPAWRARHRNDIIASQSTASQDENRKPSEDHDSLASSLIFAPKARTGIDIDASEAAARSRSLDVDPSDLSLVCDGERAGKVTMSARESADYGTDQKVAISTSTDHAVIVKPEKTVTSSSRLINNRPKPKQRGKPRPKVFDFACLTAQEGNRQALLSASSFIPHKIVSDEPIFQGHPDTADDETDTILSFGDDVAESVYGERLSGDGAGRYSYAEQEKVGEEMPDEELNNERAATNQDGTCSPGFKIWRDESV